MRSSPTFTFTFALAALGVALALLLPTASRAHCDTLDGHAGAEHHGH